MKKIYPYFIALAGLVGIVSLMSFAEGYAKHNNGGITTAPLDLVTASGEKETCRKCHHDNKFGSSVEVNVTDMNGHNILGYDPGATYKVRVKINHTMSTPDGYGFQMVGLIDKDSSGLQNFTGFSSNVQEIPGILGRKYYEHKGMSTSNEFTIDWVAPNDGAGSVTFYAVGNAVFKNNSQSGDDGCDTEFSLSEGLLLGNNAPENISDFQILGNPSLDAINLAIQVKETMDVNFNLYNLNGQKILTTKETLSQGHNDMAIDVANIVEGAYVLTIQTPKGQLARKVLVH